MAYNPYNAIKNIYDSKVAYHTNQSLGKDPAQFHAQALPSYQELVKNGYEGLASQLEGMDAVQAGELLKKYKPDEQFGVDEAYNTMTGGGAIPENITADKIINAPHPNDASIDKLMGMGTGETGMAQDAFATAQGIATGAIQTQPSATAQGLFNAYNNQNNRLNGAIQYDANGNVISGLNTEHYNIGRNQLNYLNNFDVTKQPYYQGIMDAYNLGGYNAAQGAYANGAADNGGNIDSYAAANANRQQLAFTTAGMQQAMAMANQNQQNWQSLYSQMSNDLNNQGQLSLQTLEQARLLYQTDADERMAALDTAGSLAKEQMAQSIEALKTMVDERVKDKGITEEQALKEADIANEQKKLEMEIARDLEQSNIESRTRQYESDNTLKGTMYESDNNLAGTLDTNAKNLQGTMYKSDNDLAASIRKAQADEYGSLLNYKGDVYAADRGLDKVYAQNQADKELAEYTDKIQREYNQWLLDNPGTGSGKTGETGDETGDITYDVSSLAKDMWTAVATDNKDVLAEYGLDKVHNLRELNLLLTASPYDTANPGYGLDADGVKKFYQNLAYLGSYKENQEFIDELEARFPGIVDEINKSVGRTAVVHPGRTNSAT